MQSHPVEQLWWRWRVHDGYVIAAALTMGALYWNMTWRLGWLQWYSIPVQHLSVDGRFIWWCVCPSSSKNCVFISVQIPSPSRTRRPTRNRRVWLDASHGPLIKSAFFTLGCFTVPKLLTGWRSDTSECHPHGSGQVNRTVNICVVSLWTDLISSELS
jgi:hypothetical protein